MKNINKNTVVCSLEEIYHDGSSFEMNRMINDCISNTSDGGVIIGYLVWESYPISKWIDTLMHFVKGLKCREFILILNTVYKNDDISFPFEVVYIDYFLLRVYFETTVCNHPYNKQWNFDSNKFLFLTGKADAPNRIRLLYKLYKNGLLDYSIWSLFLQKGSSIYTRSKTCIPELTDSEFDKFVNVCMNNPDGIDNNFGQHYGGFPYDTTLFSETLFRVVSETLRVVAGDTNPNPWITEKTWMTIVNNQPFMVVGQGHILERLRDMGFKTFEKYLKNPNYDTIIGMDDKLDAIVENVEGWLSTCNSQSDDILADVKYNFSQYHYIVDKNLTIISDLLEYIKSPKYDLYDLIPLYDSTSENGKWIMFYNSIKDDSWESCHVESNFKNLPKHIQQECIENFGYSPRISSKDT